MRRFCQYLLSFAAVAAFASTSAQLQHSTSVWTITDCFKYATEHNIQISSLRLNAQSSFLDLSAAKAVKIPSLSASIGHTFNNGNNNSYGTDNQVKQLSSLGNYSVNSSIVLWNYNYINNNIRQKDLLTQSSELSIQKSVNDITLLITQAYLNILLAKENLQYVKDLVSASEARVKQGQMFYNAGSIAKKDLLQLQAQLASDKYLLVQTQNAIRESLLALKQILQLPVDAVFDIAAPVNMDVAQMLVPLEEVRQTALNNFPDIKIGNLQKDVAALDILKAKSGFRPVLTASGSLATTNTDVITNAASSSKNNYLTQTANNFYQRVGLTLSIPIFLNRVNKTILEKANIAYKEADLTLQNSRLILSQAVEQAYINAINATESYDAANEQLKAAIESYRTVNEQFKLGAINTYDLLQQRNQYVQAMQAYTEAKYTAIMQQKVYEFYMGKPVAL